MTRNVQIDRRQILAGLAVMIPGAALLNACGGMDDALSEPAQDDFVVGRIANSHGHVCKVPRSQLDRDSDLVWDITGTSDHPHTITLTSAQLKDIADGTRVYVVSTLDDGHTHRVTFN